MPVTNTTTPYGVDLKRNSARALEEFGERDNDTPDKELPPGFVNIRQVQTYRTEEVGRSQQEILRDQGFELGRLIGEGGFADVFIATRIKDGKELAVKVMDLITSKKQKRDNCIPTPKEREAERKHKLEELKRELMVMVNVKVIELDLLLACRL